MDRVTTAKRSAIMSRIRGRGNQRTETDVVSLLRKAGTKGWRRQLTLKLGKAQGEASDGTVFKSQVRPVFVFPKSKTALFIDGCFWHGCPRCYRQPKTRKKFWSAKILRNRERDKFQTQALRRIGWRVIRIWECRLIESTFQKLAVKLD